MSGTCKGCRFWSEMIARALGGEPIEAMCLAADGPRRDAYTKANESCDAWKSGHHGAVDAPPDYGAETRAAYAAEETKG